MSSEVEPARQLLPYLQRADELQKHEPLVAYYCRLFAMEKGLKIPNKERTKMTNSILISLMNQLEKDKKSVQISSDDGLYLEGFASNVFAKADKQDRAGRADLNTAKTFYAASIFFEILHQFGELQPDIEQKQKYALWKAADIRKALKEGRKPEPGPPGGEDDLSISSTPESKINEDSHSVAATQRESFSADQPGPEFQHPEDSIHRSLSSTPSSRSVYPGSDFHPGNLPPSSPSRHDDSVYAPPHHLQTQSFEQQYLPPPVFPPHDTRPHSYSHELQPPNVPSEVSPPQYAHESPSPQFSYPSFQTYPSFSESNIPATSGHYSAYYQGSESAFLQQQPPPQDYTPPKQYHANDSNNGSHAGYAPPPLSTSPAVATTQYSAGSDNGSYGGHVPPLSVASIPSYTYDCNYQPPIEKIAEAHKAARFAVGALAFDDVAVAVEFLRKSLELLTNPKAEIH